MGQPESDLSREIETSSRALLDALRRQDPCYLEYLERRQHALLALHAHTWEDCGSEDLRRLEEGLRLGEEAAVAVAGMQEQTRRQMRSLGQERGLARALEAQFGPQYKSLNVKA